MSETMNDPSAGSKQRIPWVSLLRWSAIVLATWWLIAGLKVLYEGLMMMSSDPYVGMFLMGTFFLFLLPLWIYVYRTFAHLANWRIFRVYTTAVTSLVLLIEVSAWVLADRSLHGLMMQSLHLPVFAYVFIGDIVEGRNHGKPECAQGPMTESAPA